jgi:tRNA A37 threonylcarbamoyltransferase TsaD
VLNRKTSMNWGYVNMKDIEERGSPLYQGSETVKVFETKTINRHNFHSSFSGLNKMFTNRFQGNKQVLLSTPSS